MDKIGDEQDIGMGIRATPYKVHFEANELSKALIAGSVAHAPRGLFERQAQLYKDADGKWIAKDRLCLIAATALTACGGASV